MPYLRQQENIIQKKQDNSPYKEQWQIGNSNEYNNKKGIQDIGWSSLEKRRIDSVHIDKQRPQL